MEQEQFNINIYRKLDGYNNKTKYINGFIKGITKMQAGGKAKIIIPYALGYGSRYIGSIIPSYSTLVFEIELDSVY